MIPNARRGKTSTEVVAELRLLQALTLALDRCDGLSSALHIVLKEVCRTTGWVLGEAWLPSPDGTLLVRGPVWHAGSGRLRDFAQGSQRYQFRPGQGLPGRVWSSGKPAWVTDVRADTNFPRRKMARRLGIKAGFAIPVLADGEAIAIINFFVFEQRREDHRLIQLVTAVAAQLGEIIQRKIAEDALRRSRYELEAEIRERQRVAHELHDGVTQLLMSILFRLRGLEEAGTPAPPDATARVSSLLEQAIREVRRISVNLGPGILEEVGLGAALRTLGRDLETRKTTRVAVSCQDLPPGLPREISWTLYRILQEGVQNIEKHADATEVRLTLRWRPPWITAILRDNGRGFLTGQGSAPRDWQPTLGLRNMKERIARVGGAFSIRSGPGEGTSLALRIPWPAPRMSPAGVVGRQPSATRGDTGS